MDNEVKPLFLGNVKNIENNEKVEYYQNIDGSYAKMENGEYKIVKETKEIKISDDWIKVIESRDMSIIKAMKYVNEIEDKKIDRNSKLLVGGLGLTLACLIALVGRLYWKDMEPTKAFLQSNRTYNDQVEYFTTLTYENNAFEEEEKNEVLYYVTRYLQVMEPTDEDILNIGNNIRNYKDYDYDRIAKYGYLFDCADEITTYDILEYLETTEPVDKKGVLSLK